MARHGCRADGKVLTAVEQPYYGGTTELPVILDTTGQITGPDSNRVQGLLIGADSVLVWLTHTNRVPPYVQTQRQGLSGFPDGPVNGDYLRRLTRALAWIGVPVAYVLLVIGGSALALLQAHFFALLGAVLERRQPRRLEFRQMRNIALYAITPAAIIFAVYTAARVPGIDLWFVYLIAFSVFLIGGTNASRTQPAPARLPDDDPF